MKKRIKIVIFVGYDCNNRCKFCINHDKRSFPVKTTQEVVREIYLAKKKKADCLELIGGESTIRPDFLHFIRIAKKLGIPDIVTATNGRMFSDMEFAARAVKSGLGTIIFSIHGHNAKLHDSLTQSSGSFKELIQGIKNLRTIGFGNINGNTTVVRQNMKRVKDIAEIYAKFKIRNVEYIFVDPSYGGAYNNFEEYVPKISDAAGYMKQALETGLKSGFNQWKVRYVPLCHFKGYEGQISETNERKLFLTEHWAPDFINLDVIGSRKTSARRKTAKCRGCSLYSQCEGIWIEYLRRRGDSELKKATR
ncbi:MAG: radical SAM protein [Elusimicrobia bacterium]|nr:radical SAM protein [Elusimicrobiota bacterium]